MSDQYTPSTDVIRSIVTNDESPADYPVFIGPDDFERWLAAFKRETEIALLERLAAFRREHELDHDYWNHLAKAYTPGDNMVSIWLDHEVNELRKERADDH